MFGVLFHTIGMHPNFHLDEALAYLMLKLRGEEKFPGVGNAQIVFDGTGGKTFQGINGDDLLPEGVILLGIGGGMFDEHAGMQSLAKEGECTSSLVAKNLGIDREPGLQKVLKFVRDTDLRPVAQPFDISSVCKEGHGNYSPEEMMRWAIMSLTIKWRGQERFCEAEKKLLNAQWEDIIGPNGKLLKMVTAITDDDKFKDAARASGAVIIIKQSSSGNVQIFTDHRFNLDVSEICGELRMREQVINGSIKTADAYMLRRAGKVEGAEEWYLHENGKMILNGSRAHPDVPPTKIPLENIQEIVRKGIGVYS